MSRYCAQGKRARVTAGITPNYSRIKLIGFEASHPNHETATWQESQESGHHTQHAKLQGSSPREQHTQAKG
ncbi:hypothetical protein GOBAR_DD03046 [Gossypium barbadense]|nr:hypothetical protein GOBAR_DD03046 [Gossypium barbadense]